MELYLESLGCAKNLVDSEQMQGRLLATGWTATTDPARADVIIVNTCSFIEPAVNESIDTILALAKYKQIGRCRRLIVAGCLPERYREAIVPELPEVDIFLGTGAFDQIVRAVEETADLKGCLLPDPNTACLARQDVPRRSSTPHTAYVKIAEGCNRRCTFCIIPKLRGRQRSRSINDIVTEAQALLKAGVRELNLVAQETTDYGRDLSPPARLAYLLHQLADLAEGIWLRVLYGHPQSMDENLLEAVAAHPNICPYFDIPIQHASDRLLKRMGRNYTVDDLIQLFDRIRQRLPQAALRTTVIVGFPGETDQDFKRLKNFAAQVRFNHLGVFTYSDAEDLRSHRLEDHVPARIAQERLEQLMGLQAGISLGHNRQRVGQTLPVLIEANPEPNLYVGRAVFQAPEVDGVTYVHGDGLTLGDFAAVHITDALEYDLTGKAQ